MKAPKVFVLRKKIKEINWTRVAELFHNNICEKGELISDKKEAA